MSLALAKEAAWEGDVRPLYRPLSRIGSRLTSGNKSWQMLGVYGWEASEREGREYFRVETAEGEDLLVFRLSGERGMRELYLVRSSQLGFLK
jgi:hypothetical protein